MDDNINGTKESGDEFYKQMKQQRAAKLAAKVETCSRTSAAQAIAEPEMLVDGKRQISYQMEKNKGLTHARKKLTKNPRKKYKHQKAVVRQKHQCRNHSQHQIQVKNIAIIYIYIYIYIFISCLATAAQRHEIVIFFNLYED